jgi:hypothetical protein
MAEKGGKRPPKPSERGKSLRHGKSGWQKPTKPPTSEKPPSGLPPKKDK